MSDGAVIDGEWNTMCPVCDREHVMEHCPEQKFSLGVCETDEDGKPAKYLCVPDGCPDSPYYEAAKN